MYPLHKYIVFCLILFLPFSVVAEELDLSSPEATLNSYIESLKKGDVAGVRKCYELRGQDFRLPKPIPIQSYMITKKIIYGEKETNQWNSKGIVPPSMIGDVELQVKETFADKKESMFSYNLRKFDGEWKLISHSAWGIPDSKQERP